MKRQVDILMIVEGGTDEEVRVAAEQAAAQLTLRLGSGPHSVAPYVPGMGDARIVEAEFVLIHDPV